MSTIRTPRKISVQPLVLSVAAIPITGRPADFSGAIGRFSFDVSISPTNVAAGDLVTVTLKVTGKGCLDEISPPRISPGRNFKAYDPKVLSGTAGNEMIVEQTIIPQNMQASETASVAFSYFDTEEGVFKTVKKGPFSLNLRPQRSITRDEQFKPSAAVQGDIKKEPLHGTVRVSLADLGPRSKAVITSDETSRLAPAVTAFASFELTEGSVVHVLETYEGWVKIQYANKRGWIPADRLQPE